MLRAAPVRRAQRTSTALRASGSLVTCDLCWPALTASMQQHCTRGAPSPPRASPRTRATSQTPTSTMRDGPRRSRWSSTSCTHAHHPMYLHAECHCDSRSKLNRPFTLSEKIIYSHLSDAKSQEIVRGKVRWVYTRGNGVVSGVRDASVRDSDRRARQTHRKCRHRYFDPSHTLVTHKRTQTQSSCRHATDKLRRTHTHIHTHTL